MAPSVKWQIKECTTNFFSLILLKEKQLSTVTMWIQTVCNKSRSICFRDANNDSALTHIHHLQIWILQLPFSHIKTPEGISKTAQDSQFIISKPGIAVFILVSYSALFGSAIVNMCFSKKNKTTLKLVLEEPAWTYSILFYQQMRQV